MSITYENLVELLDMAGLSPRSYSGRGMMGRQCVGAVVEAVTPALADIIDVCSGVEEAAEIVRAVRTDGMGTQSIIYWPRVEWRECVETE